MGVWSHSPSISTIEKDQHQQIISISISSLTQSPWHEVKLSEISVSRSSVEALLKALWAPRSCGQHFLTCFWQDISACGCYGSFLAGPAGSQYRQNCVIGRVQTKTILADGYIYIQRRICTYMYTCYANMYVQSALLKISAIKISGWPYLDPPLSFRLCFSVKTSCGKQVEIHSYLCTNRMCKALPVLRPLRFGCRCWPFFSLCFLESLTWSNLISWSEAWHR